MSGAPNILFFDLEVHKKSKKILEYGAVLNGNQYRGSQKVKFEQLILSTDILCGHNIIQHDLPILKKQGFSDNFLQKPKIDTLFLSALLFPKKPYHPLVKDYFLESEAINDPLADAKLAQQLYWELLEGFQQLPNELKTIYHFLLKSIAGFDGFFRLNNTGGLIPFSTTGSVAEFITQQYASYFCNDVDLLKIIQESPVEFAYALAIITVDDTESLPPKWLEHQFPKALNLINQLRIDCPGNKGCSYCHCLSPIHGLQRFFGFKSFRSFNYETGKPLQQQVVEAALAQKSLLAIFPTGGGKSLTFQLPALMQGAANRSLTVIISPLQSLMKDQVDVLEKRHDNTSAATINGMLSPLERSDAIRRVEEGGANLLYISPESLRSKTIIRLLKRRTIARFVIDEAHCFSSWGQDFRVDYLYIGRFLKRLQTEKGLTQAIPVSCFTATAKLAVVDDICNYFQEHCGLDLRLFQTSAIRENLHYSVVKVEGEEKKYEKLRELLHSEEGVKIVYVSRVKRAEQLAESLRREGMIVQAYHGKLERDEKIKIQNEFISNDHDLNTIIATSAFGMGVDKDNVKMVIHYNISDSLENYMQESGRAGRRADLQAKCFILFDETDLDAHFHLLTVSKLSHKEVYQIWQGVKRFKAKHFTKSALEIAKEAGWDTEMGDLETRVKVAIAALEESGYVTRTENAAQVYAQSILVKNVVDAQQIMDGDIHHFISETQQENAKRIFSNLISRAKSKNDTRVDYLSESLGIDRNEVTSILNIFKQLNILSNEKDLSIYYFSVQGKRNTKNIFSRVRDVEQKMFDLIFPNEKIRRKDISLKDINEHISENGIEHHSSIIRDILNYWAKINYIRKERIDRPNNVYRIQLNTFYNKFKQNLKQRLKIAAYSLLVFEQQYLPLAKEDKNFKDKKLIDFSVLDLKKQTEQLTQEEQPVRFYEFILLYFHELKIMELKDGLMVFYNPMKIIREVDDFKKRYTVEDYNALQDYYQNKTAQIHIVGEYAKKQLQNYIAASQFVEDYFSLSYDDFLGKYFNQQKGKIRRPITEEKFKRIFGELDTEQLAVVKDNKSENILVGAGPGSGKTRVLVHKVASLLLMEDIKPDQFLMLTFSRPAALEFKTRLKELVGTTAYYIDIFTYHSFAFELVSKVGDLEQSKSILKDVTQAINKEEILLDRLRAKSVIVVDEYQDVSQEEYDFILAIKNKAEKTRVIVVGDDDQNIYEFRGSSVRFMRDFVKNYQATEYFLTYNYRAHHNLLEFSNLFLKTQFSSERLKHGKQLLAKKQVNGKIEIIRYHCDHMILPLVQQVKNKAPKGSTAILTYTNNEAILIHSLLKQAGFLAKLIAENNGFTLANLLELRIFSYRLLKKLQDGHGLIVNQHWEACKAALCKEYSSSSNLGLVQRIIADYEQTHPKKFWHTWKAYLREIRIEDFYHPEKDTILVSTMHKAKGKEFDHVFILLNHYPMDAEEKKRILYVAMTRAKENLFIHTNSIHFPMQNIAALAYLEDHQQYSKPNIIILECGMKDIWLGFVKYQQNIFNIKQLHSGDPLFPSVSNPFILTDKDQHAVLKFSKVFQQKMARLFDKGYKFESAIAKYIVLWFDEEYGQEYRVVLAEIRLTTSTP